ncbi:MAG TPA: hypothetical protein VJ753_04835 [Rhizomicrobium sp.]|nr:hypothetical protein [Rhizomicrobium sp.]
MSRATILIVLILQSALPVEARTFTTWADTTCGQWQKAREAQRQEKGLYDWIEAQSQVRWMLGFLTALNAINPTKKDALASINPALVRDWTDSYCAKFPNKKLSEGTSELFLRLVK